MATGQIMSETITKAVAEATRVAIQAMAEAQAEQMSDTAGLKIGGPAMKQLTFEWDTEDKYSELKMFRLEVNNKQSTYNTPQTDKLALVKKLVGKKRPPILRDTNYHRKRNLQEIRTIWHINK